MMRSVVSRTKSTSESMFVTRTGRRARLRYAAMVGLTGALAVPVTGCSDLTGSNKLPAGVQDPAFYNTRDGARGLYQTTFYVFETALLQVVVKSGLITDELEDVAVGTSPGVLQSSQVISNPLDERILPGGSDAAAEAYGDLQSVRNYAGQARAALLAYDTAAADSASSRNLRGRLALFTGFAETWLADFYCSGVPLSTLDFHKDFTYAPSSTTTQVYREALAQFDTALALTRDSTNLQNVARVARGRVYLALGQYDSAAAAVHDVPTGFQYQLAMRGGGSLYQYNFINGTSTVSDREGSNGLPYVSSDDPRTTVTVIGSSSTNTPLRYPTKYATQAGGNGFVPFVLANGIEARLIEAEVALHNGNITSWLSTLNQLRTNGTFLADTVKVARDTLVDTLGYTGCTSLGACDENGYQVGVDYSHFVLLSSSTLDLNGIDVPGGPVDVCRNNNPDRLFACNNPPLSVYGYNFVPAVPLQVHQTWNTGTGGVSGLAPLADPGAPLTGAAANTARIRLLFDERGYWLFLTGHRQGDFRRLIRQYGLQQNQVYPTGVYTAPGIGIYGTDVTMPIPAAESENPNFHGCLDRNA